MITRSDDCLALNSHSIPFFLSSWIERGFDITYRASDDITLQIVKYGEYIYDHILLFAPATKGTTSDGSRMHFTFSSVEFGGRLDSEILAQFVDAGGNILVAGSNVIGR